MLIVHLYLTKLLLLAFLLFIIIGFIRALCLNVGVYCVVGVLIERLLLS